MPVTLRESRPKESRKTQYEASSILTQMAATLEIELSKPYSMILIASEGEKGVLGFLTLKFTIPTGTEQKDIIQTS